MQGREGHVVDVGDCAGERVLIAGATRGKRAHRGAVLITTHATGRTLQALVELACMITDG